MNEDEGLVSADDVFSYLLGLCFFLHWLVCLLRNDYNVIVLNIFVFLPIED